MARWQGTTEQRGYGHLHRQERERRLALYRPGDRCAMGGERMLWWPLELARIYVDLPHDHVNGGYLPGLACRKHNRAEGTIRRNRMYPQRQRTVRQPGRDTICRTCWKPYTRAPRSCEICGRHYHPNYGPQRTCGRTCGTELQRRNRAARARIR